MHSADDLTIVLGNDLLIKLRKMKSLADDDEDEVKPSGPAKSQNAEQPAWMRALLERCREWLGALPEVCLSVLCFVDRILT